MVNDFAHLTAPAIRITRRFHFSASHRYYVAAWTPEQNATRFGKNIQTHGHNYVLEVTIQGPVDPTTGMILNLSDVKKVVGGLLERFYDHKNLNVDHPVFRQEQPSTERIALQLAREIKSELQPPAELYRLKLWETEDLYAEVICS